MLCKKTSKKAPTNGTTTIDDRLKTFPDLHDMLSTPLKKLIPLNRSFPPKIAIGPNPPITEDSQKSPTPLPHKILGGGFPL